jgi:hypothetical protein
VGDVAQAPNLTQFTPNLAVQGESRHEPETFGARVPTDSYAAWLAKREAEQQEDTEVRWVFRPRMLETPAIRASAEGATGEQERSAPYGRGPRLTRA